MRLALMLDRSIDGNGSLAVCHAKTERMP